MCKQLQTNIYIANDKYASKIIYTSGTALFEWKYLLRWVTDVPVIKTALCPVHRWVLFFGWRTKHFLRNKFSNGPFCFSDLRAGWPEGSDTQSDFWAKCFSVFTSANNYKVSPIEPLMRETDTGCLWFNTQCLLSHDTEGISLVGRPEFLTPICTFCRERGTEEMNQM